jgi:hypothetical protein
LPSVTLHGGLTRDERLAVVRQFTRGGGRLLLATDAGGEGLNLQSACRLVINLELPWNPMRLEQRIGRVDRIGQRRPVHVIHLIARDSDESRVLVRLQSRVARARADIGGADPLGVGTGDDSRFAWQIIAGETGDVPLDDSTDADWPFDRLWTPPLASEAQIETHRLSAARALTKDGDESALARIEGIGPAFATARHWRTRILLRGRVVMIWRVAAEDGTGRAVGSTIVAVAVHQSLGPDDEVMLKRVDLAAAEWRARVTAVNRAVISTRLAREKRMDEGPVLPQLFQAGLFDRRDERARLAVAASHGAAARNRADRVAAIEGASPVSFLPPQLVLVIKPAR